MAMQTGTFHPKADNLIRNGRDGGLPIGSAAAAAAIAKVGRAICGSHWRPAAEGVHWYGRAYGYRKGTSHGDKE